MINDDIHSNFLESVASSLDEILLVLVKDSCVTKEKKIILLEKFLADVDTIVNYRLTRLFDESSDYL